MVAPYLDPAVEAPATARARACAERDALTAQVLAGCTPDAAAELRTALPAARRQRTALEDHNHYIDQMSWGQLRRAALAAGARLAAHGVLDTAEDVFWLRRDEVVGCLRTGSPSSWHDTVAARRKQHDAWRELEPPLYLGVPPPALPPRPLLSDAVIVAADADGRLVGIGASPGTRSGRARVVPMGTVMPSVQPGDVLVAENAGPMWTPTFPILGALVLDQGAPLLHTATTAREFGIPAVVQTGNATRRIADGDWITVDGTTGLVELAQAPGHR
jgi:pyruvate,water dikinase